VGGRVLDADRSLAIGGFEGASPSWIRPGGASELSPRDAGAGTHRIVQAALLVRGRVREDHPHEEGRRHQQQRQGLNGSHDRLSPECVLVASSLASRVGDEHALGAWPEDPDDRFCRNGHSASSAPADEPRHDKRPDWDHEARRGPGYAVNDVPDRSPEQRTKHDGQLHDVHDIPTEQAAFQVTPV
jgi:hypothetical protein